MRAILNRQMFTATRFDSGSLGVLASVVHQFAEPGRYQALIRHGDSVRRTIVFEVTDASGNTQLDIDLADPAPSPEEADCSCKGAGSRTLTVSPKGYVLFYVSRGDGGFSVRVAPDGAEREAFDSTRLTKGDLFAVSLLAPTRYSMTNGLGKATGEVLVRLSPEALRTLDSIGAVHVGAAANAFDPARVEIVSGQGLVFRALDAARIVIEQLEPPKDNRPQKPRRRVVIARARTPGRAQA